MFGFNFERFKKTPLSKEDKRELPPDVTEKGRGRKAVSAPVFESEHQEEESRVKSKDPLRNFVPIEDVPAGEDWRNIGESLDVPKVEAEEEEPDEFLEHTVTPEEEIGQMNESLVKKLLYKQHEKTEEVLEKYEGQPEIKIEFDKTSKRVESKVQRSMSPLRKLGNKIRKGHMRKPPDRENVKTINDSKKQRMNRKTIKEFLNHQM